MTMDPGAGSPTADRMQSLLSRAVEDQISEQRQVADALSEVRAQLAGIGQRVEHLIAATGGGASIGAGLAAVSTDIREAVRMLAERLDGVGRSVQERGADLAEVKVAVSELRTAVSGHTEALRGVNQGLDALPAFGEQIGGLQGNLGGLHERLAGLEELVAAVHSMQQRVEAADQGMRELRSAFSGMAARVADLPGRADLDAVGSRAAEPLETLGSRLGRIESSIPSLLERLDGLREPLHAQADALEALRDRAGAPMPAGPDDATADRLAALAAAVDQMSAKLDQPPAADGGGEDDDNRLAALIAAMGGLSARLDEAAPAGGDGDDDFEERISESVATAVAESEARLAAHIDEAVVALAEALLSRRATPRPASRPAPPVPPPAPEPVVPPPSAGPASVDLPVVEDSDDADSDVEGDAKRRPWWRPGD